MKIGDKVVDREMRLDNIGVITKVSKTSVKVYYKQLNDAIIYYNDYRLCDNMDTFPLSDIRILTPLEELL